MPLSVTNIESNGLRARLVRPDTPGPAGVLVLSAWPGLDERTDEVSQWLAAEGLTALAWDPFSAYAPDLDMAERRRLTRGVIRDEDARLEQMHWLGYMQAELGVRNIGGIGFCMGGRMGLLLGVTDQRLRAFSAWYPTIRMPPPQGVINVVQAAPEIHCAVQVHYPGHDEATKYDTFVTLRSALEGRPGDVATLAHYYPTAEHGFLAEEFQAKPANAAAKALAWPLTVGFLRACLT
jgi:carboxymethylenebutenolidase